jgi:hypothetical protein
MNVLEFDLVDNCEQIVVGSVEALVLRDDLKAKAVNDIASAYLVKDFSLESFDYYSAEVVGECEKNLNDKELHSAIQRCSGDSARCVDSFEAPSSVLGQPTAPLSLLTFVDDDKTSARDFL